MAASKSATADNSSNSSDDDTIDGSASSVSDSESDNHSPQTTNTNNLLNQPIALTTLPPLKLVDRATLTATLPQHINTDGLSDYELLRLRNIQGNPSIGDLIHVVLENQG